MTGHVAGPGAIIARVVVQQLVQDGDQVVDVVLERHVVAQVAVGQSAAGLGGGNDPETCVIHLTASMPVAEQRTCQADAWAAPAKRRHAPDDVAINSHPTEAHR